MGRVGCQTCGGGHVGRSLLLRGRGVNATSAAAYSPPGSGAPGPMPVCLPTRLTGAATAPAAQRQCACFRPTAASPAAVPCWFTFVKMKNNSGFPRWFDEHRRCTHRRGCNAPRSAGRRRMASQTATTVPPHCVNNTARRHPRVSSGCACRCVGAGDAMLR